ncbi:MAG: chromosomal replication initiator protein DnaA [Chloroflexi bacterium]|nr:chromosomal replication initiator protein DnaA [Chloroflexota bacterium]
MNKKAPDLWNDVLSQLKTQILPANYETWLKGTVGLSYSNNHLLVGTPTASGAEWLEKRLHSMITKTLVTITDKEINVQFQSMQPWIDTPSKVETFSNNPKTNNHTNHHHPFEVPRLNPKYTFSTFIIGMCNRLAHAAALGVAENPGRVYNPLFIYGGVGLGKSHLLHAVGHMVLKNSPNLVYVTSEQFTNEFVNSIRERNTEDFRNKYRNADLLLIDDIQFIADKEQTQEGFFHTFNDLHNANKQIVITSDRSPKSMPSLEDRLRSRFEGGLMADIQPPDLETRLAILRAKADERGASVPPEVLNYIARKIQKNIRELEGSLNRVIAHSKLNKVILTTEIAAEVLTDFPSDGVRRNTTPEQILTTVAQYFKVDIEALKAQKRDKHIVLARQVAMYIMREETPLSLSQIGTQLGNRDHKTIIHGCSKIANEINNDPELRREIIDIRETLLKAPK